MNLKKELIEKIEREKKLEKIVLLRDNLNNILLNYGEMNIDSKGENILKKVADDEKNINYKNLGSLTIDNYNSFKRFGTLYDLLIDLLNEKISLKKAAIEQDEMIKKIEELRSFVLLEEEKIKKEKNRGAIKKAKTKTQRKKTLSIQKSVINNVLKLFDKRVLLLMRL